MAGDKSKKTQAKSKDKDKKGKAKKKGKGGGQELAGEMLSVASDPRGADYVRRAKGWGGLAGFAIAAYLSLSASVPLPIAGERALMAGAAGYLLGWACSVAIWRQMMIAELRQAAEAARELHEAATAETTVKPQVR